MPLHINLFFNDRFLFSLGFFFNFDLKVFDVLHLELLNFANIIDYIVPISLYLLVKVSVLDLVLSHFSN